MKQSFTFNPVEWVHSIDSTNDELKRRLRSGATGPGKALAAKTQTKGKGRMGRNWVSPEGTGLFFSFVWSGSIAMEQAGTLPMACSLAIRDFLHTRGIDAGCKWPNDVLTHKGKICGILTESMPGANGAISLVVGMGINVKHDPDRNAQVTQPASCIADYVDNVDSPETILPEILPCVEKRVRQWESGGFAAIRADLGNALWGRGKEAIVRTGTGRVTGIVEGLGDNGTLVLQLPDGSSYQVISAAALEESEGGALASG